MSIERGAGAGAWRSRAPRPRHRRPCHLLPPTRAFSAAPQDVPEILNALRIKVNVEKLNERNAAVRAASLLPKQLRAAKARLTALQAAEKEWIAAGAGKKAAAATVTAMREAGAMDEEGLKKLEASLLTTPGLGPAIRQVRAVSCRTRARARAGARQPAAEHRHSFLPAPCPLPCRPARRPSASSPA